MQGNRKLVAALLVTVVLATLPPTISLHMPTNSAGCPFHHQPAHSPLSHECCRTSYEPAIVHEVANVRPDIVVVAVVHQLRQPAIDNSTNASSVDLSPPGKAFAINPLRI